MFQPVFGHLQAANEPIYHCILCEKNYIKMITRLFWRRLSYNKTEIKIVMKIYLNVENCLECWIILHTRFFVLWVVIFCEVEAHIIGGGLLCAVIQLQTVLGEPSQQHCVTDSKSVHKIFWLFMCIQRHF